MKKILLSIIFFFMCSVAFGQIEVPTEVELGMPIVAKLNAAIPEGAVLDGGWKFGEGISYIQVDTNTVHIWVGKPGTYKLEFRGFWLNLKEVTFKDGDGNTITIQSYLGHGSINEEAEFKVTGDSTPDPQPGGKWQIMMFYDADQLDNYPPDQRALLTSLKYRNQLKQDGHTVLEILESSDLNSGVPDKYRAYINAILGDPLPRVAIAPKDGGKVLDFGLPQNYEALTKLLKETSSK